ncbi:polysaccharide deacetylase family protein [soil metagenome]
MFDRVPGLLRRGPAHTKRVALTFDDGPDELTPRYLELLDDLGVPATFFVLGELAHKHPEHIREYIRRGHQVAGHGYDHQRFTKLSRRALLDQCERTDQAIGGQFTGHPWVRPPHGSLDSMSLINLRASCYTVALWSLDSCDYADRDPASLAQRCVSTAGEVLLFHEGQEWTLDALPRIVAAIHGAGLECVTMFDLFAR